MYCVCVYMCAYARTHAHTYVVHDRPLAPPVSLLELSLSLSLSLTHTHTQITSLVQEGRMATTSENPEIIMFPFVTILVIVTTLISIAYLV